jgi:hypothetical protein
MADSPRLAVTTLCDVSPVERDWLFPPYIARGEVTALAGDGGIGKTTLLKSIVACVTVGREPWTGAPRDAADVLIMFAEDDLAGTVRLDLEQVGGDTRRVHCITGIIVEEDEQGWRLDEQGYEALVAAIADYSPALVAIDPIIEITPEWVDTHKSRDVRDMLRPLRHLARTHGCAIVYTIHLNKSGSGRAQSRVQGSADFVNFARSVLMVAHDPDDEHRRLLTHAKTNLGRRGDTLAWTYDPGGEFRWIGPVDVGADVVFAPAPNAEARGLEAEEWLRRHHAESSRPKQEVVAEANAAGIGTRVLEDTYRALGGRAEPVHVEGRRGAAHWMWPPIRPSAFTLTHPPGVNPGSKAAEGDSGQNSSAGAKNGHQDSGEDLLPELTHHNARKLIPCRPGPECNLTVETANG